MAEYKKAYKRTIAHEGAYVNDPNDRGGETYKGISRKYHPDWNGWLIIDKAKQHSDFEKMLSFNSQLQVEVERFYKENYWDVAELDTFKSQEIANEIFDTGVNQGMETSIQYLQQSLNMLNRNEQDYKNIADDGIWGDATRTALNKYFETENFATRNFDRLSKTLLKLLNGLQAERYFEIIRNDTSQEKYTFGWFNRV